MIDRNGVKRFVKETLGCNCPEEVFQGINCKNNVLLNDNILLDYEINVGNRLLVFVARIDEPDLIKPFLSKLVWAGVNKRDRQGFNRFRLVLLTPRANHLAKEASRAFQSLGTDEKVHLHLVNEDDFPMSHRQTGQG